MIVKLTYFKRSGKYYSEGEYETDRSLVFQILNEVESMLQARRLPGLVEGHSPYYVHVDASDHPQGFPGLIVPGEFQEDE